MTDSVDTGRRLRDLTTIAEIGLKLASEMDLDALLQLVAFYGTVLLEAERATLFLVHSESKQLVAANCYGHPMPEVVLDQTYEGALVMQLATDATSRFIIVPDDQRRLFPFLHEKTGGAAIISSILGKRGLLGVLAVEQKVDGSEFMDYDGETLERLVAQAGIAIENAAILNNLDSKVGQRTQELNQERQRNERLMRDLFPPQVIEELQIAGSVVPRRFEAGTLLCVRLFANASNSGPAALFRELGPLYERLDGIGNRHGLDRLNTMGDLYVAGSGITRESESHAIDAAAAALEVASTFRDHDTHDGIRVGIALSTGEGVAGVVSGERYAYEVVSDALLVATRLAVGVSPGEIAVDTATFQMIDHAFVCDRRYSFDVLGIGKITWYALLRVRI